MFVGNYKVDRNAVYETLNWYIKLLRRSLNDLGFYSLSYIQRQKYLKFIARCIANDEVVPMGQHLKDMPMKTFARKYGEKRRTKSKE